MTSRLQETLNGKRDRNRQAIAALEARGVTRDQIAMLTGERRTTIDRWAAGSCREARALYYLASLPDAEIERRIDMMPLREGDVVEFDDALNGRRSVGIVRGDKYGLFGGYDLSIRLHHPHCFTGLGTVVRVIRRSGGE